MRVWWWMFCLRRLIVTSLIGAKDSSLPAILTAPLKSPSSSLEATRVDKFFKGSFTGLNVREEAC